MSDLSNILKKQYAAQQEQALAELKSAYEKNTSALDEQAAAIPQQYEAARNDVAAQNAIARKNFNEQAAATGMNTGTAGQAELARSSAYQSALAGLNASQQNAQQALERDRLNLQAQYENAFAAQKAQNEAALQSALYQEMLRQQSYGAAYGGSSGSGGGGVKYDTHGYSTEDIRALQKAAGITVDGIWGDDTQAAYEKYDAATITNRNSEVSGWIVVNGSRISRTELENGLAKGTIVEVWNPTANTITYRKA